MSISTYAAVAKFCIKRLEVFFLHRDTPDPFNLQFLFWPVTTRDQEENYTPIFHNGWMYIFERGDDMWDIPQVPYWSKGNKKVYTINESENACVGTVVPSFFSDSKKDLQEFMKDNNLDFPIEENVLVYQTA